MSMQSISSVNIRIAQAADVPELATLFEETVRQSASQYYSPAQVQAWAAAATAKEAFRRFVLGVTTYIASDETGLLGFAGIGSDGHVASAYVRSDRLHQGIGSVLMETVLDHARRHHIPRLYAEASEFSLGLFQKFGFQQYATEVVDRQGVTFHRYLVEKHCG